MRFCHAASVLLAILLSPAPCRSLGAKIEGELKCWCPVTFSFQGPAAAETDSRPNPFLDYRLQVVFTGPSGRQYNVPGFFNADGRGGRAGRLWQALFSPDEPGQWHYRASFRRGDAVAVSLDASAGEPAAFDGAAGEFSVAACDPSAPGYLRQGRLEYVGGHYLRFRNGDYWIRGGADEPENFLAYAGFDNTTPSHHYADHQADWRVGDPDWNHGQGKAIIGAINYLASQHVNSIYFLTMNIGGDGKDVWPWAGSPRVDGSRSNDHFHFDLGKLAQWQIVFTHAQRRGVFLHFVFNEAEEANKRELDNGELGIERKLYYRELVARFGHHLALQWNLSEEYNLGFDLGPERIRRFAEYISQIDPYGHPITVHSAGDPLEALAFTFGDPLFSMTSIQIGQRQIDGITEAFRQATRQAGRPLPVSMDEFTLDAGQRQASHPVDDAERHRREKIWPTYLSGGMLEFILDDLLETDSFKTPVRRQLWRYLWNARSFVEELPFWEMAPADELLTGAGTIQVRVGRGRMATLGPQVFAKAGSVYAIYLPVGNRPAALNLREVEGVFEKTWYDPRLGRFVGGRSRVVGGAVVSLGLPPAAPDGDWVILVKRTGESL